MEENQVFENKIVVDNNSFLNFVAIYQSLIRYCSEEETMDIIETIEKSLDNDSINFRMEKKIKPYLFINGKTTVKWSWRLDKHKLSHVKSITKYIKAGLNDMYPQLGIPHPIYDVYLVGMYEFWKPKKWDIYKLNTTKYSYARTEVNQRIINLSNKIRTLFIDENELCFQKNVRKLLPCGTRPIEGEATSKYFYYFQEKDVLRVADKLHPNKLNNFHTLQADKVFIQGVEVSSEETNNNQINSFGHKDTARILFDGEGYISLLGLYKICKRKEDADFIYNLIITNQQKSDSIDIFIFLDGYELVLKKKNIFNLGIPIDDDYSLIARLASKINKEVDEPKIALKFTGLFIYKNYQNILPYIVPCQESYVNMTKISYEFQRNVEFQLALLRFVESKKDASTLQIC